MKKIAFLIGTFTQGGAERQVYETTKMLSQEGYDITIMYYLDNNNHYEIDDLNIKKIKLPSRNLFLRLYFLYSTIKRKKFDYVISYLEIMNLYLGILGFFTSTRKYTKLIISERNTILKYSNNKKLQKMFSFFYKKVDIIFTNSKSAKYHIENTLDIKNIKVLYNYLNLEKFKPIFLEKEELLNISKKIEITKKLILVPGRIHRQKNQKNLIKNLDKKIFEKYQLLIVGKIDDENYYKEIEELINNENLNQEILILKSIKKIEKLYNLVDLIVLPSLNEGFPNVILEAMATKKICISTNVSDIAEIIDNQKNGYIIKNLNQINEILLDENFEIKKRSMEELTIKKVRKYGEEYLKNFKKIIQS